MKYRATFVAAFVLFVLALPMSTGSQSGRNNRSVTGPYGNGLIAFARGGNGEALFVIGPDGTGERQIFNPQADDTYLAPAWSPDGKWIAFTPGPPRKGLWMMRANGSRLHRITIGKGAPGQPSWSPNGKWIAFADRQSPRSDKHDIYVVRTNGFGLKRLTRSVLAEDSPAWGPYGEIVFVRGRNLWRMKPDGSGKRLLARNVGQWAPFGKVSWSPGGSRLAFSRAGDPWTMKRDGTDAKRVAQIEGDQSEVAWSPDSRWLVTDSVDRGDLMLVRIDGSEIHSLTNRPDLYNMWPAWQRLPR
jgi:Tol biopolymer transport system component